MATFLSTSRSSVEVLFLRDHLWRVILNDWFNPKGQQGSWAENSGLKAKARPSGQRRYTPDEKHAMARFRLKHALQPQISHPGGSKSSAPPDFASFLAQFSPGFFIMPERETLSSITAFVRCRKIRYAVMLSTVGAGGRDSTF